MKRLAERTVEMFWLIVVGVIIGVVAFVVVGACAALVPIRWIIDWDAKRKAEGDKWTS